MRIAVQLTPTARKHSASSRAAPQYDALANLARDLRVSLEPMHPDSADETLSTWYSVDVPDEATAHTIVSQLLRQPAVAAAYLKPPDELP